MNKRSLALALTIYCASSYSFAGIEDLRSRVKEVKLPNGLTALLVERHLSPTVAFHIFFPVGSLDDESGKTGLAHLFEHMMFKGTKTVGVKDYASEERILDRIDEVVQQLTEESDRGATPPGEKVPGGAMADKQRIQSLKAKLEGLNARHEALLIPEEYWKIYERAGAEGLNAGTSNDFTEYTVSLPSNKIELWMAMESDRVKNAVTREFYKERSVVMEERRLRVDTSPEGRLWEVFLKTAFGSHPYGEPVVGEMKDLQHISRADAVHFFGQHYRLSRAVITIVGDFSTSTIERWLQRYFGVLADTGPAPQTFHGSPPRIDKEIRVEVPFDAEPEILIGYLRPAIGHPDEPALEALADVMEMGRTSRLYKDLVMDKRLALSAGVWNGEPGEREPCLIVFHATPRAPHSAEDCLRAIDNEIGRIQRQPPSAWEVQKVKNNIEADLLRSLASNTGLGWRLGYTQALVGDWRYLLDFLDRLKEVSPEDVSRVARTYLDPHRRVIAVRVRKGSS